MRASEKMLKYDFVEVDIRHRMAPLRILYIITLTHIFKVKNLYANLWKTVRASEKCSSMTYIDIHHIIHSRTVTNVVLYDLDLNFQDQTFKTLISLK